MRRSRNFFQRGSLFDYVVMLLFFKIDPNTTIFFMRLIIGQTAKRNLNGVSQAGWWWPNIECWLGSFVVLHGIGTNIAKKPYILWFFRLSLDPLSPTLDPHMQDINSHGCRNFPRPYLERNTGPSFLKKNVIITWSMKTFCILIVLNLSPLVYLLSYTYHNYILPKLCMQQVIIIFTLVEWIMRFPNNLGWQKTLMGTMIILLNRGSISHHYNRQHQQNHDMPIKILFKLWAFFCRTIQITLQLVNLTFTHSHNKHNISYDWWNVQ